MCPRPKLPTELQARSIQTRGRGCPRSDFDLESLLLGKMHVVRFCAAVRQLIHSYKVRGAKLYNGMPHQGKGSILLQPCANLITAVLVFMFNLDSQLIMFPTFDNIPLIIAPAKCSISKFSGFQTNCNWITLVQGEFNPFFQDPSIPLSTRRYGCEIKEFIVAHFHLTSRPFCILAASLIAKCFLFPLAKGSTDSAKP